MFAQLVFMVAFLTITTGRFMASVRPRIKNYSYYTITNAVELAPLCNLVSQYLEAECLDLSTRRTYENSLRHFQQFLGVTARRSFAALSYSDVTRARINDFRKDRVELEALASVALRVRVIKAFCNWMHRRYGVVSPAAMVPTVIVPNDQFRGLSPRQYQSFVTAAKSQRDPVRRIIPLLFLGTGLRNNEVRLLTHGHISADNRWFLGVEGKGKKFRNIPLSDELIQELQVYLWTICRTKRRPALPLFASSRGGLLANKTIWRIIHDIGEEAGLPSSLAHPHALRHTFAYRTLDFLESKGVKIGRALIILRDILGHSSINTTLRYLGNDAAELAETMREMPCAS